MNYSGHIRMCQTFSLKINSVIYAMGVAHGFVVEAFQALKIRLKALQSITSGNARGLTLS
jgi:hypothetical protein